MFFNKSNKHFKLTSNFIVNKSGAKLYQIQATRDSKYVKKGDLGGYVQSEDNLSDEAWISENAQVYGPARVYGSASVYGNAKVFGQARVFESAHVYGEAQVSESAKAYGFAQVFGFAQVYGDAHVYGYTRLTNEDKISASNQCMSISGFSCPITVTYSSINIDGDSFTPDQLDEEFTDLPRDEIEKIKAFVELALGTILHNISKEE